MSLPVPHRQPEQYNPVGLTLYRDRDERCTGRWADNGNTEKARYGAICSGICETSRCIPVLYLCRFCLFCSFLVLGNAPRLTSLVLCILASTFCICCCTTIIRCVQQGFPGISG